MAKSHGPWLGASPEPSRALLDGLMKVVHLEALCDWGNPKWRLFVRTHPIKIDDEMGYPHLWKPLYCIYDTLEVQDLKKYVLMKIRRKWVKKVRPCKIFTRYLLRP